MKKIVENINGLRAIAALGTILCHFVPHYPTQNAIFNVLAPIGNSGVSLFFVISGFVITRILFESINSKSYFSTFYMRRVLRIFPLYYLGLLTFILIPYYFYNKPFVFYDLFLPAIYISNIYRTFEGINFGPGHYWSLAVEEHFYLLWPLLIYVLFKNNSSNNRIYLIVISLIAISIGSKILLSTHGMRFEVFTLSRFDQISLGALLAYWEKKKICISNIKFVLIIFLCLFIAGLLKIFSFISILDIVDSNLIGFIYFAVIGICINQKRNSIITLVLENKILVYLGKISFGLYVFHPLLVRLLYRWNDIRIGNIFLDFLFLTLITILVSIISFEFYEKKFLQLKTKFKY